VVSGSMEIPRACRLTVTLRWMLFIFLTTKGAVPPDVSDRACLALHLFPSFHTRDGSRALAGGWRFRPRARATPRTLNS
jgi:hypothetical protein